MYAVNTLACPSEKLFRPYFQVQKRKRKVPRPSAEVLSKKQKLEIASSLLSLQSSGAATPPGLPRNFTGDTGSVHQRLAVSDMTPENVGASAQPVSATPTQSSSKELSDTAASDTERERDDDALDTERERDNDTLDTERETDDDTCDAERKTTAC